MSDALERVEARVTTEGAAWVPMLVNEDKFADSADADLRALCAAVETLTAERDAANAAHDRVAKSLGVTAEGAVEIAEENVRLRAEHARLRAEHARLRADLAAKVEGLKRLAHAGSDLNEEDCVHCAHNAAIDAVLAAMEGK